MDTFGKFEGRRVDGGTLKFSGTRGADRIIKDGDTVYFLAKCTGKSTLFEKDAHGDLIRQMRLAVDEFIECPESIEQNVAGVINNAIEEREALLNPPGLFDGEDGAEEDV